MINSNGRYKSPDLDVSFPPPFLWSSHFSWATPISALPLNSDLVKGHRKIGAQKNGFILHVYICIYTQYIYIHVYILLVQVCLSLVALTCKQASERQRPVFLPEEVLCAQNRFKQTSVSQPPSGAVCSIHTPRFDRQPCWFVMLPHSAKSSGCGKKNPYFLGGAAKNQESSQLEPNVAKRELDPHLKHQGVNTLTVQVCLSLVALTCKQASERQRPVFLPEEVLCAQNRFKQTSVSQPQNTLAKKTTRWLPPVSSETFSLTKGGAFKKKSWNVEANPSQPGHLRDEMSLLVQPTTNLIVPNDGGILEENLVAKKRIGPNGLEYRTSSYILQLCAWCQVPCQKWKSKKPVSAKKCQGQFECIHIIDGRFSCSVVGPWGNTKSQSRMAKTASTQD